MENRKQLTIDELEKLLGYKVELIDKRNVELADMEVGQVFTFCGIEFIVLEQTNVGAHVVTRDVQRSSVFDSAHNNYKDSVAARQVKNFEDVIVKKCEDHGLNYFDISIQRQISLTSMDGRNEYGQIGCRAGLLTMQQYRENVKIFDKYRVKGPWFLVTPASTEQNGCTEMVTCINNKNFIEPASIRSTYGLRPTLILKQDIIVEVVKNII